MGFRPKNIYSEMLNDAGIDAGADIDENEPNDELCSYDYSDDKTSDFFSDDEN